MEIKRVVRILICACLWLYIIVAQKNVFLRLLLLVIFETFCFFLFYFANDQSVRTYLNMNALKTHENFELSNALLLQMVFHNLWLFIF